MGGLSSTTLNPAPRGELTLNSTKQTISGGIFSDLNQEEMEGERVQT